MSRSVVLALLGAAAAVGAAPACIAGPGREDVALQQLLTRMCDKARECDCPRSGVDETTGSFQCGDWPPYDPNAGFDDSPYRESLAFDAACVERWTSWVDSLSCETPTLPSYADLCPLYHGTGREGEACWGSSLVETDCARGLFCLADACRDPRRTALGTEGEPCDLADRCDAGLACSESLCIRLPGAGDPCLFGYLCNGESYCDGIFCESRPGPGEPCGSAECREGSFCSSNPTSGQSECQPAGDVGDPCMGHRQCLSGNCPAGFCEEPAGEGDPCGGQLPCGPGLICDLDRCRPGGEGIPAGSVCELLEL